MRPKNRRRGGRVAAALVLLALAASPAAYGQSYGQSDGFFSNADGVRNGDNNNFSGTSSWLGLGDDFGGSSTWYAFDNGDVPLGGGLLVLALSGVCYAGAKKVKRLKLKD